MKNKLGITSLIFSALVWLVMYIAISYSDSIGRSIAQAIFGRNETAGYMFVPLFFALVSFLFVIGIIIAIKALLTKEEFKGYPVLAIIIFFPILVSFPFLLPILIIVLVIYAFLKIFKKA